MAEKRSPNRTYKAHWCAMYFDETGRRRKLVARTKEEVEKKLKAKLPVRPEPKRRSFSNRSLAQLEELCESIGERARRGTGRNRTDE